MEPVDQSRVFSERYEITHLIARGGMAQVYRANDLLLDRVVALKVLFPELSVDQTFVERFRREAQAAAKLSHPNIVPVFDWGEDNGTYFIVMEFVDGEPLSATLRREGTLPPVHAASIAAGVAAALSYAHRHGVVHRDVKPGNVLLATDGAVKVTDFGIARAINTEEGLTQAGSVMGTATYFSPEQAEGVGVDARSDVYSLGIVLFEMLAGRPPFQGDSPVAVASKHVRDQPQLVREFATDTPAALEAITMMAIAKAPSDRYDSAEDMRADLQRFVEGKGVLAPDPLILLSAASAVNATTTMDAINNTQAVPIFPGPRTDIRPRKSKRSKKIWIIGVIALVVVLLAGLGAYAAFSGSSGSNLTVPNVVGMTESKAATAIQNAGLKVGTINKVASDKPANQVVSTNPGVGLPVNKGASVDLSISDGKGAHQVLVPNVTNQDLPGAEATLQAAGFTVKVVTTTSSSAKPNTVISQTPAGGSKAAKGSIVTLTTVAAPQTVAVPDLVGQPTSSVGATLSTAQLSIGSQTTQCDNTQPNSTVISSSPAAGAQVQPGSAVNLVVSTGPCSATIPNVIGLTYSSARGIVTGAGFVVSSSCASSDTVTSQSPSGFQSAPAGTSVTLTCAASPTTTTTS